MRLDLSHAGLSLVELVVVCTVLGLLASAVSVQLSAYGTKKPIRRFAENLLESLDHYSYLAAQLETKVFVEQLTDGSAITFEPGDKTRVTEIGSTRFHPLKIPAGIRYSARFGNLGRTPGTLILRPDGTATPGTIILQRSREVCEIKQALRGMRTLKCGNP